MILPSVKRIIAIGDLHGDYKATIIALKKANIINKTKKWCGGDTVVVQLGDQVDRKARDNMLVQNDEDSEFKIMNLFDRLHKEAVKNGGAVYSLIGNHELMNVLGDFSYTSDMGIKHFGDKKKRLEQFSPGGKIAVRMSKTRVAILQIGEWIFVHGGITPHLAKTYKLDEINELMRQYLEGNKNLEKDKRFRELFLNSGSILWTRRYSEDRPDCKTLMQTLDYLGAKKMVVGHTPQKTPNCKCRGAIWRVDTGMSDAFGKKTKQEDRIHVLEILDDGKMVNII